MVEHQLASFATVVALQTLVTPDKTNSFFIYLFNPQSLLLLQFHFELFDKYSLVYNKTKQRHHINLIKKKKTNSHTPKMEIHSRHKLYVWGVLCCESEAVLSKEFRSGYPGWCGITPRSWSQKPRSR